MPREDLEALYWSLSEIGEPTPPAADPLPDEVLAAYREGRLSEDEAARVEALLVADGGPRRRLAELAGVAAEPPPASLRRRLLPGPPRAGAPLRWWLGLAAAAAAAVVGWLAWPGRPGSPGPAPQRPGPPAYEVQIFGLSERRGPETAAAVARVLAETKVRIVGTVAGPPEAGVEVTLYREVGGRLERLSLGEELRRTSSPGGVVFEAPAAVLAGPEPGLYEVFVVVAWEDDLPEASLAAGRDPAAALAGGGRQVHRLSLQMLAP